MGGTRSTSSIGSKLSLLLLRFIFELVGGLMKFSKIFNDDEARCLTFVRVVGLGVLLEW